MKYELYKNSKLLPLQDFGGRIFTTAVQAQKTKSSKVSHGPKTPLVECVFYFVLICTFFWLNVNICTCFWNLPIIILIVTCARGSCNSYCVELRVLHLYNVMY